MNGEPPPITPQVPVTTLAGIISLTELLPQLPLPTSVVGDKSRSLLFHPRVAEEAKRHLSCQDPALVSKLARALALTSANHIELKQSFESFPSVEIRTAPPLLQGILKCNSSVFSGGLGSIPNSVVEHRNHRSQGLQGNTKQSTVGHAKSNLANQHGPLNSSGSLHDGVKVEVKSEPVVNAQAHPNNLIPVKKEYGDKQAMKEPVVRISKLSAEEVKALSHTQSPRSRSVNNSVSLRTRANKDSKQQKYKEESSSDSEKEDKKKPAKYFKSREKEREEKKRREKENRRKRKRSYSEDEDFDPAVEKKRQCKGKRGGGSEDVEEQDDTEDEDYDGDLRQHKKPKGIQKQVVPLPKKVYDKKRIERKLVGGSEKLSSEELMETGVYLRFTRAVEKIFDQTEDLDLTAEIDEDGDMLQEYLIPKYELADLCSETGKLKSLGAMSLVPPERLVRLLNILEKNIRDGAKVTPIVDDDDDDDEKLWLDLVMERILRAVDASLTVVYILTSPNMSKRVYLEDVIERCVQFAKFQLSNTIYPSFDPVYRVESKDGYICNAKKKRAHMKGVQNKSILGLYNKLNELVGLIADLLSIQTLTDTTVLQLSTLGVAPFFVESVSELQLSALKLVTKVFSKYDKHRQLLLDDILASIARLPSSKRSLRTYRLNSDENIQMLTALVLQLIQCVVELPEELFSDSKRKKLDGGENNPVKEAAGKEKKGELSMDSDVLISHKYEKAMHTAYSFLSVFLQKTGSKSEEIDYRPLFENFVQDLLLTVNKPEWPAAELLLSFLGSLLVQKFSSKGTEQTLRVASLDCLGIVAARLRKDAVMSQLKVDTIDQIIQEIREEESKDLPIEVNSVCENGPKSSGTKKNKKKKIKSEPHSSDATVYDEEEERTIFIQRVLLDWLAVNSENESALLHARHFYIGQWYRDAFSEIMRQKQGPPTPSKSKKLPSNKKKRKKKKGESSEEESAEDSQDEEEACKDNSAAEALKSEVTVLAERRKSFLLTKVPAFPPASPGAKTVSLQTHIDYENAELITRYLASKRAFSRSFDNYLKQILRVLSETSIVIRTKAMRCLTLVVEADPGVLARTDMQLGVHHSFLDHSTSVREAAVDLVGKFVLSRPELLPKYYDMIAARILDTGVSVRKRVIKIMKNVCLECPSFPKIPEICVKMIRRVNDEDGIKKLVQEVFQNMWFTPVKENPRDEEAILLKINNITEVVIACQETGLDWFEQLLQSLFKPKEDKDDVTKIHTEPPEELVTSCRQIVSGLVRQIIALEEKGEKTDVYQNSIPVSAQNADSSAMDNSSQKPRPASQRLVACLKTLYMFAKICPQLLVNHAITLQPYLSLKCQTQGDYTIIGVVARTLELIVPLMEHPGEVFLAQLEEDAVKLILLHDRTVIMSCVALLGSIVNTVTRNYKLIRDCFNRYFSFIVEYKKLHEMNNEDPKLEAAKPFFRRALYTVGLLLRHFNLHDPLVRSGLPDNIIEQVFTTILYFMTYPDSNIRHFTLQSLGSVCIRHYEIMMCPQMKELYSYLLLDPGVSVELRIQTLVNIEMYLQEEEIRMIKQDQEWAKLKTKENLKEMCDVQSGMASTIIQVYLKQVLECMVACNIAVRHSALRVIQLVLAQGLVHPVQIVPYLICMSSDSEEIISHSADKQLQDIERKYPGFINMKAMQGFRLSYRLQTLTQAQSPTRGYRIKGGESPSAVNGFLYSIMRGIKQQRRAVAMSLLKQFDEQARSTLSELLYIADNLVYFPYQVIDEPLFIIHHIDIMLSVTGSNLLQAFREALHPPPDAEVKINPETGQTEYIYDEDDEDMESVYARLPDDLSVLNESMVASQGCLLLLMVKEHLKETYGITDTRILQYSPSDTTKQFERGAGRKSSSKFTPKPTLQKLKENTKYHPLQMTVEQKRALVEEFLDFKALMLKIDADEDDDDEDEASRATRSQNPENRFLPRSQRLQESASDVPLLPGTLDGWQGPPPTCTPQTQEPQKEDMDTPRTPIKPLTIKTSQLSSPHRNKRHRTSSRHKAHKKHKKKKKRRRYSDSQDEDSEYSDPDFLV